MEDKKQKCGNCNCPKGKKHRFTCSNCGYGHKYSNGACMWCGHCSKGHQLNTKADPYVTISGKPAYSCMHCGSFFKEIKDVRKVGEKVNES